MTVLESFAAAVPVVCTDLGGLPELVRDGLDGRVVAADDPAALAAALEQLLADPSGAHAMGARARERMLVEFSPQTHLERLDAVYEEARMRLHANDSSRAGARR